MMNLPVKRLYKLETFRQDGILCLRSRFPSLPLFAAMSILENLPSDSDDLDLLLNHFGSPKLDVLPPINFEDAQSEWMLLKQLAVKKYNNLNMQEFWKQVRNTSIYCLNSSN